jgi:hypothetical protein
MECTIYRNDRILPIVIKEYFEEVKTDHPSWQHLPRRMLRHRAIQQCARLALGISANEGATKLENKTQKPQGEGEPLKSRSTELKNIISRNTLGKYSSL